MEDKDGKKGEEVNKEDAKQGEDKKIPAIRKGQKQFVSFGCNHRHGDRAFHSYELGYDLLG